MNLLDRIKKPLVIVNPNANEGRAEERWELVGYSLRRKGFDYDVEIPRTREETIEVVRKDRMHEAIFVFSGDGGVNVVSKGLMQNKYGKDKMLVALPGVSANDIAEECGYGSLDNVCDKLIKGTEREMDGWRVNEEPFLGFASIGLGAAILEERNKRRFFRGKIAYVTGAVRALFRYNTPKSMNLKIDKEDVEKSVLIGVVSNIRFYADHMKIAPDAIYDDGQMDLCLMENLRTVFQSLPVVYKGTHIGNKGVHYVKTRKLKVYSPTPVQLEVDGDFIGKYDRFKFEHAGGIRVLVAKGNGR